MLLYPRPGESASYHPGPRYTRGSNDSPAANLNCLWYIFSRSVERVQSGPDSYRFLQMSLPPLRAASGHSDSQEPVCPFAVFSISSIRNAPAGLWMCFDIFDNIILSLPVCLLITFLKHLGRVIVLLGSSSLFQIFELLSPINLACCLNAFMLFKQRTCLKIK